MDDIKEVSMIRLVLIGCLILVSCKSSTTPQPAECDTGFLPCDENITECCEVVCDELFHPCGEFLTECCMDTTSHQFSFVIDTLGEYGSYLNDVWIVDENNIWVVGNVETDSGEYNAARWDGNDWELLGIYSNTLDLYGIWYFSENDIWVTSHCFPYHWDGVFWTRYHLNDMGFPGACAGNAIWASSPDDIYFVGDNGSIVHYDGSGFTRMESRTESELKDIGGTPDGQYIFATGWNQTGHSIALEMENGEWQAMYEGTSYYLEPQVSEFGLLTSVDVYADTSYFTTTVGLLKYNFITHEFFLSAEDQSPFYDYNFVDIFVTSETDMMLFSRVFSRLHYNGSTWQHADDSSTVVCTWSRAGEL